MRGRRSFRVLERPAPSPTSSKRPFDLQRAFDLIQGRRVGLRLTIGFRDVFVKPSIGAVNMSGTPVVRRWRLYELPNCGHFGASRKLRTSLLPTHPSPVVLAGLGGTARPRESWLYT